jgi:hypothetical protein
MNKQRPILKDLVNKNTTDLEKFQNLTIRPIIKMQHSILIVVFKEYLIKRKIDFNSSTEEKNKTKIKSIYANDTSFKKFNLGLIIGHFTTEEYLEYNKNTSEFNRRILQIIVQRLQDSLSDIL